MFNLKNVDGEMRIRDLELAERLEFAEPRAIRKLIKRNEDKLLTFGHLYKTKVLGKVNKKVSVEYWLNQKQIDFITHNSRVLKEKNKKYLYVVKFSNGVIKIGHTDNLSRRIKDYDDISKIFDCSVIDHFSISDSIIKEIDLINFCNNQGVLVYGKEYFKYLEFEKVVNYIKLSNIRLYIKSRPVRQIQSGKSVKGQFEKSGIASSMPIY